MKTKLLWKKVVIGATLEDSKEIHKRKDIFQLSCLFENKMDYNRKN